MSSVERAARLTDPRQRHLVAYYEPKDVQDVRMDFPAQIAEGSGELVVMVPDRGAVR